MRIALKVLLAGAIVVVGWCTFLSCSSLEGQAAPALTGGVLISDGLAQEGATLPATDWRLLAFFSPG